MKINIIKEIINGFKMIMHAIKRKIRGNKI